MRGHTWPLPRLNQTSRAAGKQGMRWHRWPLSLPHPSNHQPPRALVFASDLPQICKRFCTRSSEAAIRSFDIEFLGPEFGLVWQRL